MQPASPPSAATKKHVDALRKFALGYPETSEDAPWGHIAFKVKTKNFVFMFADASGFTISVKLPESNALALALPFVAPTGYGLGRSGWVTATFAPKDKVPLDMLRDWIDESFRAIAPKRLAASVKRPGK